MSRTDPTASRRYPEAHAIGLPGRQYLPSAGRSHVVLTSNRQEISGFGTLVAVDTFTEEETLSFLAQRTGLSDRQGAREVAREVGYLPLALSQAASVVVTQRLDYPTYLERLGHGRCRSMRRRPARVSRRRGCAPP